MNRFEWIFVHASSIGNSHIKENIPCQDACNVLYTPNYVISVVCDGAGSCLNSDKGSKFVAEHGIHRFNQLVKRQKWNQKRKFPSQKTWNKFAKETLYTINKDLENYSINTGLDYKSLSCTLIVLITLKHGLLITHIGDGRAGYCNGNGEWHPMIKPYHGELANQTVFITSDIWSNNLLDEYSESKVITEEIKAVCLMSDGCEKAAFECNLYDESTGNYYDPNRPFPPFFNTNMDLLPRLKQQGISQTEMNNLWAKFLESGNAKLQQEVDDKTMIFGVNISSKV